MPYLGIHKGEVVPKRFIKWISLDWLEVIFRNVQYLELFFMARSWLVIPQIFIISDLLSVFDFNPGLETAEKARQAILKVNPQAGHYQVSQNQDGPSCQGWKKLMKQLTGVDVDLCPKCKTANLIRVDLDSSIYRTLLIHNSVPILDSSWAP